MFRCAERLSEARGLQALITGESLGQVASQTIESITCTNDSVALPVLRPLIGMDKNEIVRHALHIDTYEISIQPFEDCCTIFLPKHPQIKPTLEKVIAQESKLDIEKLIEDAMTTLETIRL
jgi:thiamine biosynthesis protein ThiI